jgi:serine/threonine protein kinase
VYVSLPLPFAFHEIDRWQAIVDGDPPDLPAEGYSEAARDFVRACLHKIPKMRPPYAMLLRHAWLAPLMKPPTISEDEEAEAAAEAGADTPQAFSGETASDPETADKEVADWVRSAIKCKLSGKMGKSEKPALHAAPLDAVPGSPLLDRGGLNLDTSSTAGPEQSQRITGADEESEAAAAAVADAAATADPEPRDGVTIESPHLITQKVHSMDFADGVGQGGESNESEGKGGL